MKQKILSISGRPGLYKLLSRGKSSLIVEALDGTHKRTPTFNNDRITSLIDIAMYTNGDDIPLMKVLDSLKKLEDGKKASINQKTASGDELREYFAKVLPDFDRERVHVSDIKKLIQWYNILIENDITDFVDEEEAPAKAEEAEETPETKAKEEVPEAKTKEEAPEAKAKEEAPKKKATEKKPNKK